MADAACPEAMALLHALWDLYWNGPGSCDYGDHAGYTWAEDQALADAAERVEDHYVAHGCRVLPPGQDYCSACMEGDDSGLAHTCPIPPASPLPLHRTEAGYPRCSTCDGGGCPDCTDPA